MWPTNSQTSRFFANILILKGISSFDQGLIMIHQWLLQIHQDSKVAKLGFCRKSQLNFDQALLSHTLCEMTHPKLIFKRMQFTTIHIHIPRSKNLLTRSYEFGHYRSFWKVNKNTFFFKAYNLIMEYQNEMRTKRVG